MPKFTVEVLVRFRKVLDTKDFVTEEDLEDLEEDDDPDSFDISEAEALSRFEEQLSEGDPAVQDLSEFDSGDIDVRMIGG